MSKKSDKKDKTKPANKRSFNPDAPQKAVVYPNAMSLINSAVSHIYGSQSNLGRILGLSRQALWQRASSAEEANTTHFWWAAVSMLPDDSFSDLVGENAEKRSYLRESGLDDLSSTELALFRVFAAELVGVAGKWESASRGLRHELYIKKLRRIVEKPASGPN